MDPASAVLAALDAEERSIAAYRASEEYALVRARGRWGDPLPVVYRWPERSCVSMVKALCGALGVPVPAYGPWEALGEREATKACLGQYGSMGTAHQTGLVETGHWEAVAPEPSAFRTEDRPPDRAADDGSLVFHPRPGDVLSWAGRVLTANEEVHEPRYPGVDVTGVCGVYGIRWAWTRQGISAVVEGELSHVTRVKPCR